MNRNAGAFRTTQGVLSIRLGNGCVMSALFLTILGNVGHCFQTDDQTWFLVHLHENDFDINECSDPHCSKCR